MSDDEINRKVAEIDGWTTHYKSIVKPGQWDWIRAETREMHYGTPPYVTDWDWCGPLIEKYNVDIVRMPLKNEWFAFVREYRGIDSSPQRAICLAVIAAQPTPATLPPEAPIHDSDRN